MLVGRGFGAASESIGELVFNTSMTGYQEILTDPSYRGQIVVMTQPHIGNYGTRSDTAESDRPWAEGFVVRDATPEALLATIHRAVGAWRDTESFAAIRQRGMQTDFSWRQPAQDYAAVYRALLKT